MPPLSLNWGKAQIWPVVSGCSRAALLDSLRQGSPGLCAGTIVEGTAYLGATLALGSGNGGGARLCDGVYEVADFVCTFHLGLV